MPDFDLRTLARRWTVATAIVTASTPAGAADGGYDATFAPPDGRRVLAELPIVHGAHLPQLAIDAQSRLLLAGGCRVAAGSGTEVRECIARLAPAGTVDVYGPSFNGRYVGDPGAYSAIEVLPDGRVVAATESTDVFAGGALSVIRADGAGPDLGTFGGSGRVVVDGSVRALARQADGSIVAGLARNGDFHLRRYALASGASDTSFANGGRTVGFDLGDDNDDRLDALLVLADDRIVAAGPVATTTRRGAGLIRLLGNGDFDPGFGTAAGKSVYAVENGSVAEVSIAGDATGRIIVFVTAIVGVTAGMHATRLTADGVPDPSWAQCADPADADFAAFRPLGDTAVRSFANDVVVQADGRILLLGEVHGTSATFIAAARLDPDGCLDHTFGSGGRFVGTFGSNLGVDAGSTMAIGNGGLMVLGTSVVTDQRRMGIARLTLTAQLPPPVLLSHGFEAP